MNTETEILDTLTRRPGERYFSYIKRISQNENARIGKLAELEGLIKVYALDLESHWSELCRAAKAYGILKGEWRESKR